MNLRKLFNIPTKYHESLIEKGKLEFLQYVKTVSDKNYEQEKQNEKFVNGKCKCGCTVIVDKISEVKGSGSSYGDFIFGSGVITSSFSVKTNKINHCTSCGNQWVKYKQNFQRFSPSDIMIGIFDDISSVGGEFTYGLTTIEKLQNIPAETLWLIFKTVCDHSRMWESTKRKITLRYLRKHFKTIY